MKTAVIALTKNGSELARRLGNEIPADVYVKQEFSNASMHVIQGDFTSFVGRLFPQYDALVFVMAAGIVVRAVASYVKDKRFDPAVVVLDEKGQFVISLLSGHIGGANRLAKVIASKTGGSPVITTATDVNDVIAFDVFAKDHGCIIENIQDLKYISSELVNGGKVAFLSDYEVKGVCPENIVPFDADLEIENVVVLSNRTNVEVPGRKILMIRPRNLILGIGCKRGTAYGHIKHAVEDFMAANGRSILSLKCIATVDLKKDEQGILDLCSGLGIGLQIISREEIEKVEGNFTGSAFVKENIGVASVAEPCSMLAAENTRLICGKTVYKGITLALSEEVSNFNI